MARGRLRLCLGTSPIGIGITLGFHRLLTHRSLRVPRPVEYFIALLGTLALQGGPIEWVSTHRVHHAHSDHEGDPHDIHGGLPWAHIEWLYRSNAARLGPDDRARYAADLISQPFYRWLDRLSLPLQVLLAIALYLIGGWPCVIWGIFVRLVFTYHCAWFVNSASHAFGYRSYETTDRSTNCWWVR